MSNGSKRPGDPVEPLTELPRDTQGERRQRRAPCVGNSPALQQRTADPRGRVHPRGAKEIGSVVGEESTANVVHLEPTNDHGGGECHFVKGTPGAGHHATSARPMSQSTVERTSRATAGVGASCRQMYGVGKAWASDLADETGTGQPDGPPTLRRTCPAQRTKWRRLVDDDGPLHFRMQRAEIVVGARPS